MNCVPGDLAVIVRVMPGVNGLAFILSRKLIGHVVRVVSVHSNGYVPTWTIAEPILLVHNGHRHRFVGIEDSTLQPIRGMHVTSNIRNEVKA
ncbi:hypothetical protein [Burkholderia ambifaria]|uniref:hypothetical protein n=1 Tax=Burkholderia ambifaria TaxID=152480 RepID=UPI00158E3752|nr:hypothetical protein [Burkholderia ambifaria]MBR8344682.1 hypothetical protein [Burkholderia ambifaria]